MRHFSKKNIEDFLQYTDKNGLDLEFFSGKCTHCGQLLSEVALPKGPENKLVCLEHREDFVKYYEELIRLGELRNTKTDGIIIKTYEEQFIEKRTSDTFEGLTVGEIILLDWIHLKKTSKEKPNYFNRWYCIDGNSSSTKLNEKKLIRIGNPTESLHGLTREELESILKKYKLKKTGTKKVLLERIKNSIPEKNHADLAEPVWISTEKGRELKKKYDVIIWAHKKHSTVGYQIAVTPYSVVPYINLNLSNEMIAISVTKKMIKKILLSKGPYSDLVNNALFQAKIYYDLKDKKNSLDSLLLGFLFLLSGVLYGQHLNTNKTVYIGIPCYTNFKKELINIQHDFHNDFIVSRTKSIYKEYEDLLPKIRLFNCLSDFIEALSITLHGTENEWNKLFTKWKNNTSVKMDVLSKDQIKKMD
ncbi:MAG: SAP domain-containing protein [Olleya sp.]